jgi:hypothetical protein
MLYRTTKFPVCISQADFCKKKAGSRRDVLVEGMSNQKLIIGTPSKDLQYFLGPDPQPVLRIHDVYLDPEH